MVGTTADAKAHALSGNHVPYLRQPALLREPHDMQAQKEAGSVEQSIIDICFLANRMSTSFPGVGRPMCGSEVTCICRPQFHDSIKSHAPGNP